MSFYPTAADCPQGNWSALSQSSTSIPRIGCGFRTQSKLLEGVSGQAALATAPHIYIHETCLRVLATHPDPRFTGLAFTLWRRAGACKI